MIIVIGLSLFWLVPLGIGMWGYWEEKRKEPPSVVMSKKDRKAIEKLFGRFDGGTPPWGW